jgi:hypothetical protein
LSADTLVQHGILPQQQADKSLAEAAQNPGIIKARAEQLYRMALDADKQLPKLDTTDSGQYIRQSAIDPVSLTETPIAITRKQATPDAIEQIQSREREGAANRDVQWAKLNYEKSKNANDNADPGKYTQVIVDPNLGPIVIDRKTNTWVFATGPSGQKVEGKNVADAKQLQKQLAIGITEARKLIPIATGSGVGRAIDAATGFVGMQTEGDNAATQLETLAGWMTSNVPRMQGPQSDKDTLLYRQMAAQVGDRTKTREARLKALDTLEQLQKKYAEQSGTTDKPVPVANDAEYNALPTGTRFVTPDGKTGTKR